MQSTDMSDSLDLKKKKKIMLWELQVMDRFPF